MRTVCTNDETKGILEPMQPRPNTKRFNFLIDLDLLHDLTEWQHRKRLRSVTDLIHLLLREGIQREKAKHLGAQLKELGQQRNKAEADGKPTDYFDDRIAKIEKKLRALKVPAIIQI